LLSEERRKFMMTITDRIEINPKVMMGKPVIRGTRIPVELILRTLSEGAKERELLEAIPGSPKKISRLPSDMRLIHWPMRRQSS
jgi:uncharacterized protein (DUF433 family)